MYLVFSESRRPPIQILPVSLEEDIVHTVSLKEGCARTTDKLKHPSHPKIPAEIKKSLNNNL
jgi:hypothetical protein